MMRDWDLPSLYQAGLRTRLAFPAGYLLSIPLHGLRAVFGTVILNKKIRSAGASEAAAGRGRVVFSSSGNISGRSAASRITVRQGSLLSSVVSGLNGVAAALFVTLFPSDCRLCGNPLLNISRLPVCDECLSAMRPISGMFCAICGERVAGPYALVENQGEVRCGLCRRSQPAYVKATAYGSYEGGLRELIHLLKYEQVRPAANVLGRMLAEAIADLQPLFASGNAIIVPVPLHARKLRQRGFNQSELILRAAVKLMPAENRPQLSSGALERTRETQSQIGLSRHQRRENMRGAFAVSSPEQIAGREVLLVDDVFTTGTTVSECARVLRRAGASKVFVATVARTLKAEAQHALQGLDAKEARVAAAFAS
jgi:ComF family protein